MARRVVDSKLSVNIERQSSSSCDPIDLHISSPSSPPVPAPGHCFICGEIFVKPRLLPCGHNFCDPCIRTDIAGYRISVDPCCPRCKKPYKIPEDKVDGLPISPDIRAAHIHLGDDMCKTHRLQINKRCEDCKVSLCAGCFNEKHRHKNHTISNLKQETVKKVADIQSAMIQDDIKVNRITRYMSKLEEVRHNITKKETKYKDALDKRMDLIISEVTASVEAQKRKIGASAEAERQKLSESIAILRDILEKQKHLKDNCERLAVTGDDIDIDAHADNILAQLNQDWSISVPEEARKKNYTLTKVKLRELTYLQNSSFTGVESTVVKEIDFDFDILSYSSMKVTATRLTSFDTGFDIWDRSQFCMLSDGTMVLTGKVTGDKDECWQMCRFDQKGEKIWKTNYMTLEGPGVIKPCGLSEVFVGNKRFIAASHARTKRVLLYDVDQSKFSYASHENAFEDDNLYLNQMCTMPPNTLLILAAVRGTGGARRLIYLRDEQRNARFKKIYDLDLGQMSDTYSVCAAPTQKNFKIVITSFKNRIIQAFQTESAENLKEIVAWEQGDVNTEVGGIIMHPHGVCADRRGHLYVADGSNKRVIVLNPENGKYIQTLLSEEEHGIGFVETVGWTEADGQRKLIVAHRIGRHQQITIFHIGY